MNITKLILQGNADSILTPEEGSTENYIPVRYDEAQNALITKDEEGDEVVIGSGAGGGSAKFYEQASITIGTTKHVQHNLNLSDPDAFIIRISSVSSGAERTDGIITGATADDFDINFSGVPVTEDYNITVIG